MKRTKTDNGICNFRVPPAAGVRRRRCAGGRTGLPAPPTPPLRRHPHLAASPATLPPPPRPPLPVIAAGEGVPSGCKALNQQQPNRVHKTKVPGLLLALPHESGTQVDAAAFTCIERDITHMYVSWCTWYMTGSTRKYHPGSTHQQSGADTWFSEPPVIDSARHARTLIRVMGVATEMTCAHPVAVGARGEVRQQHTGHHQLPLPGLRC